MPRRSLLTLPLIALAAIGAPAAASAAVRLHPATETKATASSAAEEARIAHYWTPARMRSAPPLEGRSADPFASASFAPVADATVPPYAVNGRIFIRQGRNKGYCSGTAINSPSRRLVLTAGHCVNSGPLEPGEPSVWTRYAEFVPAYTDGTAPFGVFVARRANVYAPKTWVKNANSNFDVGALLTGPNESGQLVADAVGGGATIVLDRSRHERFETYGYPGESKTLQHCVSPFTGNDRLTYFEPGPPTLGVRCHWLPGASGGGWLIEGGASIDGLTSYGRDGDLIHTYGPYFSSRNVGPLVAGF
jgi:V8-like Glu-specific endopeptidase